VGFFFVVLFCFLFFFFFLGGGGGGGVERIVQYKYEKETSNFSKALILVQVQDVKPYAKIIAQSNILDLSKQNKE
jgi:hypothetical protein